MLITVKASEVKAGDYLPMMGAPNDRMKIRRVEKISCRTLRFYCEFGNQPKYDIDRELVIWRIV